MKSPKDKKSVKDTCHDGAIEVIVTNTPELGCLEVKKEIGGEPAYVPDADFTVTVTGPSYPSGTNLIFHVVDGVVTYDAELDDTACLCGLIPGEYTVAETPPADWVLVGISPEQPVTVDAGTECDEGATLVTVTNTPSAPTCGTACAAQGPTEEDWGENLFSEGQANWFTYIEHTRSLSTTSYPIFTGKDTFCGWLDVWEVDDTLYVQYTLEDTETCDTVWHRRISSTG